MTSQLALLWLAALPLMGSPGAATLSLAGMGTGFGFRPGLRYLCGIMLGTFAVLLMIATGVTVLILQQPVLVCALTVVAAAGIGFVRDIGAADGVGWQAAVNRAGAFKDPA